MSIPAGPSNIPNIPPKRKSRSTRGLQNKVIALEEQMEQVKTNLENVVSLLLRLAPSTTAGSGDSKLVVASADRSRDFNHTTPNSSLSQPNINSFSHRTTDPVNSAPPSLESWVQQIAGNTQLLSQPTRSLEAVEEGSEGSTTDNEREQPEVEEGMSMMREMLRREERKRLRADGHIPEDPLSSKHLPNTSNHQRSYSGINNSDVSHGHELQNVDPQSRKRKRSHNDHTLPYSPTTRLPDPIADGLCSEVYGKELFNLFFRGAHAFIPVYDPGTDTWESLRLRSPFSISTILFVGQKIVDAGHEASTLQKQLKTHAEQFGAATLFSPIANAEALQAMIVLASWGDTGWRPGSHAVSMAFDMELYKCLPKLSECQSTRSSSSGRPSEQSERKLVVGSRLWLLVCKMAIEMAYNHGRPLIIDETLILPHAHALLNHPSRLPTDGRIIASCELLLHRLPLHRISLSDEKRDVDQALQRVNDGTNSWEAKWRDYYTQQGIAEDNILVTDLTTQRCFSSVLANSYLLRDIRSPHDVGNLPAHRRRWLLSSLDDARFIAGRILVSEKDKLLYANHYSHVALASVSRIYIRLATLFPEAVDLRRVAKDLTQLTDVLAHFPGFSFARQLRYVISRARKRRDLPPETRPGSPKDGINDPDNRFDSNVGHSYPAQSYLPQPIDAQIVLEQNGSSTNESPTEFDPFLAEQMFNQTLSNSGQFQGSFNFDFDFSFNGENNTANQEMVEQQMQWISPGNMVAPNGNANILSWLDFPALDLDQFGTWNGN